MKKVDEITKRDFPSMAKVLWDFRQVFGEVKPTFAVEDGKQYGEPSQGEYVKPVVEPRKKK